MSVNPESKPSSILLTFRDKLPGANLERLRKLAGSIKLTKPLPEKATNIFENPQ